MLRRAARLPDPLVGLAPDRRGALGLGLDDRPQPLRQAAAAPAVQQDRVERRPEDVVLTLVEGSVAEPHRMGARVAGQLVAGRLGQVAPPVDPVHDLQGAIRVRLEVGHELHELVGLPVQVEEMQRLQGEGRIADPGEAVVPVALAAGRLRQRGRGGGDGRARRHVCEALDRERRALDRVAPAVVGQASAAPASAARSGWWPPCARSPRRRSAARPGPPPRRAHSTPARPARGRGAREPSCPRCRAPCRSAGAASGSPPTTSAVWRSSPTSVHSPGTRP